MEIKLVEKEKPIWLESFQEKRLGFSAESVVPDSQGDIARIVWTQGGLLLKGKELKPAGVVMEGEAWASVLYFSEEGALEGVRLSKSFRLDFDTPQPDPEAMPQLSWELERAEARALNPRKLAVSFSVRARLWSFQRGSLSLETQVDNAPPGLHLLPVRTEALSVTGVWEKSFTLREQFSVPEGKPIPRTLLGQTMSFQRLEPEQIGNRTILKGELRLDVWGKDEAGSLARCSFSLPFSQLLDTGEAAGDLWLARIEPSSIYLDWTEGLNGGLSLDAEIHAVAQLYLRNRQEVSFLSDAYSSVAPLVLERTQRNILADLGKGSALLQGEERLPMPEDCADLLSVQSAWEPWECDREGLRGTQDLELLYRRRDGELDCAHRSFTLKGEPLPEGARVLESLQRTPELHMEGDSLRVSTALELHWDKPVFAVQDAVTGLSLPNENPWAGEKYPSLFLVAAGEESLWSLAKQYRSSVESIRAANPEGGELLLIPHEEA